MTHYDLEQIYPKPESRRRRAVFLRTRHLTTIPKPGDTINLGNETLTVRAVSDGWVGSSGTSTRIEFEEWADE